MLTRRQMLAITGGMMLPVCTRVATAADAPADLTRVLPAGEQPADARLGKPKTLNDYFPMTVPKTLEEWKARRQRVREQVLVANGLWPMPEKTPLNAVIHSKIERDDYTIEKVYFQSMPGHYVTGNLYRPKTDLKDSKKRAGVLNPHGHWNNGRFYTNGDAAIEKEMKAGAEKFKSGAKSPLQARSVTQARMGMVSFFYDMVGYADSKAVPHILKSGVPHPEGFHDAEGELRLQSVMGLQTWNSVRALDFLESLPDVDPNRMAVTGASGGGTQTFLLAAIDDRLAAAFPAVMVSTGMQGGCVCENCSLLRVGTGNIELAGLFAPKPMAMSAANDWTKEIMTKGYPELKELWKMYGVEDKVLAKAWLEHGHNYNQLAREMMYQWFNKHLLGNDKPVEEKEFVYTSPKDLSVFDDTHPVPKDALPAKDLRVKMSEASDKQIAAMTPKDAKSLTEWQTMIRGALRAMVVDELPKEIAVRKGPIEAKLGNATMHKAIFGRKDENDAVPTVGTFTDKFKGEKVVIWIHPEGKSSIAKDGKPVAAVQKLWDEGFAVVAPDLLGTGELTPEKGFAVSQIYSGFTYGYNRSLFASRVHDVLTIITFARGMLKAKTIHLVGWESFGPIATVAKAMAGEAITKLAVDLNQFRFENITKTDDPMILPGATKYGGIGAFVAACVPGEVLAHNHKGTASGKLPKAAYEAAGAIAKLKREEAKLDMDKVIEWLVK